jgi:O-antigen/teichoic acid export membrane protein
MFGERWSGAAELTQILAVGGMVAALGTGTGALLLAAGRPGALLGYNLAALLVYTIAVLVSVPFGVTAVCVAVVTVRLITFVVLQRVVVERTVGIPILETVRDDVIPALAGGLPQLAVTMLGMRLCVEASLPVIVSMALPGGIGLAIYAAIVRTLFPATWADMRMLAARLAIPGSARAMRTRIALGFRRSGTEPGSET